MRSTLRELVVTLFVRGASALAFAQVFYAGFAASMSRTSRNTQLTVGVLSVMVYAAVSAQFQPYKRPSDDVLWNTCLYSLFLTLYIGQLQACVAAAAV